MEGPHSPPYPDNNEKLIGALQACFSDLVKTQKEQSEKLHKAVEALQRKPPAVDKKTVFWKHYQTLADEHDKELLHKFITDLDTSLIFAGLFSAVSSAFIIQIQPQILPGGSLAILIAQCLLVFSLFSTLLAALLAVLGKQWLMYYSAAGERGTIEARGLERQRKFDGLQRWNFTAVMHLFPLLLQLALFMFSAGLAVYLWKVHIALAIIVLVSTSGGLVTYVFLLMTSLVAPDSPFQNPLTPFLSMFIPLSLLTRSKESIARAMTQSFHLIADCGVHLSAYVKRPQHLLPLSSAPVHPALPSPQHVSASQPLGAFPAPSPEAPAVAWVLETSTDPLVLTAAAEVAVDLQWPVGTNLTAPLVRLRDSFLACFVVVEAGYEKRSEGQAVPLKRVRTGMAARALTYGRAYCVMRLAHRLPSGSADDDSSLAVINHIQGAEAPTLLNVVWLLSGKPNLDVGRDEGAARALKWALRVIPSVGSKSTEKLDQFLHGFHPGLTAVAHLDEASFADYVFCLNSFLDQVNSRDMGLIDKSGIKDLLMYQLLDTLYAKCVVGTVDIDRLTLILETTARLAKKFENTEWQSALKPPESLNKRKTSVYKLCSHLNGRPGSRAAILAAVQLASVNISCLYVFSGRADPATLGDARWVHTALEGVQRPDGHVTNPEDESDSNTMLAIEGLIQALLYYPGDPTGNLSLASFRTILRGLSHPSTSHTAFLLLTRSLTWRHDPRLWPAIEASSLWLDIGRIAADAPETQKDVYIDLGHALAQTPDWVPIMRRDLAGWLDVWLHRRTRAPALLSKITAVLTTCWLPEGAPQQFEDAALAALSKVWAAFDFEVESLREFFRLARCTGDTLRKTQPENKSDDTRFTDAPKAEWQAPLGTALLRAAENARAHKNRSSANAVMNDKVLEGASNALEQLAHTILTRSHPDGVGFFWRIVEVERQFIEGQNRAV